MPQNVEARAGFLTLGRIWSLWGLWASGPEWLSWNKTQFLGWLCKVWGLLASALGSLARAGPEHQWPWLHERGNMLLRTAVKYCWGWEFGVCSAPAFNWVGVNESFLRGGFSSVTCPWHLLGWPLELGMAVLWSLNSWGEPACVLWHKEGLGHPVCASLGWLCLGQWP